MLRNKIYHTVFLFFILAACAVPEADLNSTNSSDQNITSEYESDRATEKEIDSLQSDLEKERKARLEAERKLKEIEHQQNVTTQTSDDKSSGNDAPVEIKTPRKKPNADIAEEYNRVVDAYIEYLGSISLVEEQNACSSQADLSELNQMQRAALRDACTSVGYRDIIAKPQYNRGNQTPEDRRQPENTGTEQTMDSLIQIFDIVIRSVGR